MTDEEAFLQAILAEPDSDDPRLIFADWLEERGDPRSELIQVQCALAKKAEPELKERERRLLEQYAPAWIAPLAELLGSPPSWFEFRRGFVEHVPAKAEKLLAHADDVSKLVPLIRSLHVMEASGHLDELAGLALLSRLTSLNLSAGRLGLEGASALVRSPHLSHLRTLVLHNGALGDDGLRALANASTLGGLRDWVLTDNGISNGGIGALAESRNFPDLESIHLGHDSVSPGLYDSITREDLVGLAQSTSLTSLRSIHWYELTDDRSVDRGIVGKETLATHETPTGKKRRKVQLIHHLDNIW